MVSSESSSSAKLVLGLDVGTSAIKAGSFELNGRAQATSVRRHPIEAHAEVAEQDTDTTWKRIVGSVREVAGGSRGEFVAVATASQCGSL